MSLPRWLYASTPESVAPISVRVTAAPMASGTVLAREAAGGPYVRHDPLAPGVLGVGRAVLLQDVPGEPGVHEALAITKAASLMGRLLNDSRGIDLMTHRDLETAGLRVRS